MSRNQLVLLLIGLFTFLREATENAGQRVEAIQKWCGGKKGDSWCCYLVTMILDIAFQGKSPIPRTGVCQEVYDLAKDRGWLTNVPSLGDLFFYINAEGHAHHIGFVTGLRPLFGTAGNTSADGKSSNGTGCYQHEITATVFARWPRAD